MKRFAITAWALCICSISIFSQEEATETPSSKKVKETFSTSRIINGHSTEVLEKNELEFRVEHKFGDMFGANGGVHQFFGLDNSADIRIAFEYGITDYLMVGVGRNKGAGPYRGLVDGFVKGKILSQTEDNSMPLSLAVMGGATITYAKSDGDITSVTNYDQFAHRLAYASQLIVARKFGNWGSIALMPTYTHRNYVAFEDQNGLFSLGGAFNVKFAKKFGVVVEYYHNFHSQNMRQQFKNSLAVAFEWNTFGHVFSIYLANARGFSEQQFIPYTTSNWLDGQFRLGFAITRSFQF
jgi:hypothetical protein